MTKALPLASLVEPLSKAHVLCVGDVMLDRFVRGTVERISPEAPIPVLHITSETAMLGGAGNVVRNLIALGAKADFVAAIGDDESGREISHQMQELDGASARFVTMVTRPTSIKTRFVAGTQQMLRADKEGKGGLKGVDCDALKAMALDALNHVDVMVLSDYDKGVITPDLAGTLIAAAKEKNIPVIVDPKGTDYSLYQGATLVTPNRKELMEATRLPAGNDEEVVTAAQSLIKAHDLTAVLVTRSQDGMTLVTTDGDITHLDAETQEVFDVSGAGDTVVATIAAGLASGASLAEASALSNAAAGVVVAKAGTAVVYSQELAQALHRQDIHGAEIKVLTHEPAEERRNRWKTEGKVVGFTNGCFDLLHPGHIALLQQARAACDRLIVGLNSDASVKRLKGNDRPVQNETSRATVLASLELVDAVVIFDEDTPLDLITTLKPDVLIKGADYKIEEVVGADVVQAYGGKVVLADLKDGHSTTNTIARMNGD